MKKKDKNFVVATPIVLTKMNPHSQKHELNVIDHNCFSTPEKFPEVMEQQLMLDSDDMDNDFHIGGPTENYKYVNKLMQGNPFCRTHTWVSRQ